ncbi:phage baseplate assembly protein V [Pseudoalteromonas sp. S16_S37]|uniref:phage baseplate assembly protein V n=1 Tax=Pseudoalteromonas sp. S16_S37 TaxID=2720228 RepID=UPI0016811141|nr:phage baseplate assembly protein V [Pseudoalteromonas sp. S16_S37]MBD1580870.1 phage tail protein [Pseudoalteromonas sp. S16_S37]
MDELLDAQTSGSSLIQGVVIALVTNNQDPQNLARIKVSYPMLDNNLESDWIRMVSFMAGKDRGGYFLPEVGDEVLVAFAFGNINCPYVIGALYNGVDTPPQNNEDGENNIREIRSRSGSVIRFNDKDSQETVEIIDKTGNNKIVIATKDNTISISTDQDINLSATKGTVAINAQDIKLNASNAVSLNGAEVKIKAENSFSSESGATTSIKSGASVSVKGITINLN